MKVSWKCFLCLYYFPRVSQQAISLSQRRRVWMGSLHSAIVTKRTIQIMMWKISFLPSTKQRSIKLVSCILFLWECEARFKLLVNPKRILKSHGCFRSKCFAGAELSTAQLLQIIIADLWRQNIITFAFGLDLCSTT